MRFLLYFFWSVIIVITVSLTVINTKTVFINLYFTSIQPKLPVLLLIVLCLGVVLGMLVMIPTIYRLKRRMKTLKKQVKNNSKELNNLRKIPLKDKY